MRRLAALLSVIVLDASARAEPTEGRWQGTSWGFELRAGAAFRSQDEGLDPIPSFGLGFRVCTLLTLIDAELYVATEGFDRATATHGYELRRTSIGVDLRLHPLFVRHLQGGLGDRIAAGVHLAISGGADLLSVKGADRDRTDARFAFGIGLGMDLPLTEPNDAPWSVWLGLGMRLRFVGFPQSAPGLRDMDETVVFLALGIRFHDISGVRLPVPPELDDVD